MTYPVKQIKVRLGTELGYDRSKKKYYVDDYDYKTKKTKRTEYNNLKEANSAYNKIPRKGTIDEYERKLSKNKTKKVF